ncbi:MAG TPA: ABC transporter ATP-binding protein [Candidatus Polarisedimenticolaceae bacterium]|nr:ABC transporter ATP-binding protein [Candidatus Polarisedimenticolaceae bacterium]
MSEPLLRAEGLFKAYASADRRIAVLQGLDLEVSPGEAVAVVGESGVGKSTLLHLLGGLDRVDGGRVLFHGEDLARADLRRLAAYRNRDVGFVFQFHHLLPEFTALENVHMPFRIARRPDGVDGARALLVRLGLERRLDHRPAALSGGEQQRVAIARALVAGPQLVLADEPTGNLDPVTGRSVFALLRELQRERGFSLVLVTHSERLARGCDRLLQLDAGRLRPLGEAESSLFFGRSEA